LKNEENKVVVQRRIRATREELFDAWVDPEGMCDWMCPGDVVSTEVRLDARVGGKVHFKMVSPTGIHEHTGEYRIVDRPSKLAFTWTGSNVEGQITLVTVDLVAVSSTETDLTITHELIPDRDVSNSYQSGWAKIVDLLERRFLGGRGHA
jgi:uncharacterized protein YndB with AHSA1/START domain